MSTLSQFNSRIKSIQTGTVNSSYGSYGDAATTVTISSVVTTKSELHLVSFKCTGQSAQCYGGELTSSTQISFQKPTSGTETYDVTYIVVEYF
jgi:molybdopterin-binding protein